MEKYKVVFFGTPNFVLPVCQYLWEKENLLAVVTQPAKPKGRGLNLVPSPVRLWAEKIGLPVFEPQRLKEEAFFQAMQDLSPDLGVVFAYGKILPPQLLSIPKFGFWNLHASLLPKFRGASPIVFAILSGEKETGITVMQMDEGMDTGPILWQERIALSEEETTLTLTEKLSQLAVVALDRALRLHKEGKLTPVEQDHSQATYAPLLKKEDGFFTWDEPAYIIERKVRAFQLWPSAWTWYRGRILKLLKARSLKDEKNGKPGEILAINKEGILVVTGQGQLLLQEVQLEGKKKISAFEFALGQRLKEKEILA